MMTEVHLHPCELPLNPTHFRSIGTLLSEAFSTDEAMISLLGPEKWRRISRQYFELQFPHADTVVAASEEQMVGVLLARSPRALTGWDTISSFLRMAWLLGPDYPASQRISHRISGAIPVTPHWYINQLAVQPCKRSNGIAGRLLAWLLDQARREPVLVDCATELTPLYERAGFHTVAAYPDINLVVMAAND